ncbi:MARCKS-related protein 1-B [Narcine bancroftii]|uniref:MARCKS-related protein 1-B n=1 Tax=Narcine bancroftii TaxID=1343680 RepID=UPI00383188A9
MGSTLAKPKAPEPGKQSGQENGHVKTNGDVSPSKADGDVATAPPADGTASASSMKETSGDAIEPAPPAEGEAAKTQHTQTPKKKKKKKTLSFKSFKLGKMSFKKTKKTEAAESSPVEEKAPVDTSAGGGEVEGKAVEEKAAEVLQDQGQAEAVAAEQHETKAESKDPPSQEEAPVKEEQPPPAGDGAKQEVAEPSSTGPVVAEQKEE